jgi:hypothetical protein
MIRDIFSLGMVFLLKDFDDPDTLDFVWNKIFISAMLICTIYVDSSAGTV